MRLLTWLVVVAVLASLVYSGAQAGAMYLQASRLADESVEHERPNLADTMLQGRWRRDSKDYVTRVRERLVKALSETRIPAAEDDVTVTEEQEGVFHVRVRWSQPMFMLRGKPYLLVPVTMTRTYTLEPPSGERNR